MSSTLTTSNLNKLTRVSTITDLSRVLFSTITDNSFISIGNVATVDSSHNMTFTTALDTYNDFFVKAFQLKTETNGTSTNFRIDSELHSIYSIDVSGDTLLFRENWGQHRDANTGYLTFDYDASYLKVTKRYFYNTTTNYGYHELVSGFSQANYYVKNDNGILKLVSTQTDGTKFHIYNYPFNVAMPYDFNPGSVAYQTNDRVSIVDYISKTTDGMESKIAQKMMSAYTSQIAAVGNNTDTATAAETMLNAIKATLADNGESLRYDTSVYIAFRTGLLSQINNTDSIANGENGQNTVPYVYFTNEQDDSVPPKYHPFMCIASYSITDRPNHLLDVPRPPGDGTGEYSIAKVTRDATLQDYLFKIPMKDYGLISTLTENTMTTTLHADYVSQKGSYSVSQNCYNYSSKSGLGVTIDGLVMYPILNNTVVPAQCVAEITSSGFHVGQGMGLHYHADGHGATDNDFNLYNTDDYVERNHPPLIGFGFDGIALYGKYESAHSSMHGYSTELDIYGGHSHGNYGYHYHSHSVTVDNGVDQSTNETLFLEDDTTLYTTTDKHPTYDLHLLIKGAWKGQINNIPYFWTDTTSSVTNTNNDTVYINGGESNAPSYSLSQKHKYVGKDFSV